MNWIFGVLLAITLAIMIMPFTGLLTPEAAVTFWIFGSVLAAATIIWIVAALSPAGKVPATTS
ncbi:MAG TPA: hypothetical protein VHV83_05390 [Armatimonadota bacterium]|nr:hypothetical protein [Armatimonadota bacterium]